MEKDVVSIDFPQQEIEKREPRKEKQTWRPSPWNEKKVPNREEPEPIMMCKRCKQPK